MNLRELSDQVEAVSVGYADKFEIRRDETWFILKLHEEVGELTQAYLRKCGQGRPGGESVEHWELRFREELADVLCHVLLLARHHAVDLEAEIDAKWLAWKR